MSLPHFSLLQYGKTSRDIAALHSRCNLLNFKVPILEKTPSTIEELEYFHEKYPEVPLNPPIEKWREYHEKYPEMPLNLGHIPHLIKIGFKVEPASLIELWLRYFKLNDDPPPLRPDEILQVVPF